MLETVGVDILSEQGHLLEAAVAQVAHLAEDALHVTAALASAGIGNDTVVAEVVAASHDADKTANLGAMQTLGHHIAVGFRGGEFGVDGLVAQFCLCEEVGQGEIGIRSGHQIGMMVGKQVVFHPFGHAAQHPDDEAAALALAPFVAQGVEGVEAVVDFLFGIVAHRAGVQQYGIRIVERLAGLVACHIHDGCHHFRVGHVHLAAVGLNI